MARNTKAMKRGWNYDIPNALLKAMVDGTEAFKLRKDSASICAGVQMGTPTYTLAGTVDGAGASLATGYSASGSNRFSAFEVCADTGSTDLAGDTYQASIHGKLTIGTTQTNASLIAGLFSLDVGTVNITSNYFAVRGHLDFWGSSTLGGTNHTGAVSAYVENEATTTLSAGGYLSGVDVYQVGGITNSGINPAINIRASSTAARWQYGIHMLVGGAVEAVRVGAQANTDGSGLPLNSTTTSVFRVFTDTASTDIAGAVDVRGGLFRHLIGTTQTNSSQNAFRGQLVIATGKNVASGNYFGIRGYLEIKGTTSVTGAGTHLGALQAYVENGGTTTVDAGQILSGIDCYQVGAPTNNGINSAIHIRGTFVSGFSFPADATCISANVATGAVKKIACDIGGTVYYINTYLIS